MKTKIIKTKKKKGINGGKEIKKCRKMGKQIEEKEGGNQ